MAARESRPDLRGEVVAVTGGGGVLCSAIAQELAACGAAVAVLDISEAAAARVAAAIRTQGGRALAITCDVVRRESLESAAERTRSEFGATTALINGAGGNRAEATTSSERSFFDLPVEAVRGVLDLNFLGTFLACQVFGREMAARGSGSIINISSMNAQRPITRIPSYSAAKSAVSNFTQWLAVHLSQNYGPGLRVNAIAPGFLLTEQNRYLLTDPETGQLTARGRCILDHTPMARFGEPADVVGAVLWLLSDSARFVHGVAIPVDGGFNAFAGV